MSGPAEGHRARASAIASALCIGIGSWYWMQIVHECGHALLAFITGGRVVRVVLEILSFSRTDVDPNPHPLMVAWGGPSLGAVLPFVGWVGANLARSRIAELMGWFAGFCLIANGAYIGVGSLDNIGDAGDMLLSGGPRWTLWAFGLLCVPAGIWVWHRTLKHARAGRAGAAEGRGIHASSFCFVGLAILVVAIF